MAGINEIVFKTKGTLRVNSFTTHTEPIVSDVITIGSDEWRVSFERQDIDGQLFCGVYLHLHKSAKKSIEADLKAFILGGDYKPQESISMARLPIVVGSGRGIPQFVNHSTLLANKMGLFPDNCLIIGFNVTTYKPINYHKKLCRFPNSFLNKDLSECRLVVGKREFFVSKAILGEHSEAFRHLFTNDAFKKKSSEGVFTDIDPQVFEEFLRFLYNGDSDRLEELAEELLQLSVKFMVLDLKTICLNLLYLRINPKNAFKMLDLMTKYKSEELKAKVLAFIAKNTIECLMTSVVDNDYMGVGLQLHNSLKPFVDRNKSIQTMAYTYVI